MWTRHKGKIAAMLAAVWLAGLAAPSAADEPSQRERAEQFARQGMERLMQALDLLLQSIPQYELPVINDNGDIIIRRRHGTGPAEPAPAPANPDVDSTNT
jgi:hypothetical protein